MYNALTFVRTLRIASHHIEPNEFNRNLVYQLILSAVPLEIDMLTREHFNRWYKLGPYFLSLISFEIPFQVSTAIE